MQSFLKKSISLVSRDCNTLLVYVIQGESSMKSTGSRMNALLTKHNVDSLPFMSWKELGATGKY